MKHALAAYGVVLVVLLMLFREYEAAGWTDVGALHDGGAGQLPAGRGRRRGRAAGRPPGPGELGPVDGALAPPAGSRRG